MVPSIDCKYSVQTWLPSSQQISCLLDKTTAPFCYRSPSFFLRGRGQSKSCVAVAVHVLSTLSPTASSRSSSPQCGAASGHNLPQKHTAPARLRDSSQRIGAGLTVASPLLVRPESLPAGDSDIGHHLI